MQSLSQRTLAASAGPKPLINRVKINSNLSNIISKPNSSGLYAQRPSRKVGRSHQFSVRAETQTKEKPTETPPKDKVPEGKTQEIVEGMKKTGIDKATAQRVLKVKLSRFRSL